DATTSGGSDVDFATGIEQNNIAAIPTGIAPDMDSNIIGAASVSPLVNTFSDDQLEKIAKIKGAFSDTAAAKVAQLHTLSRELRTQLSQANIDKSQVMDIQSKINNLKNDISNAKLNMRLDTIAVLTAEQRQKFHHMALQRQVLGGRKGHGHGHHRHGAKQPGQDSGALNGPATPPA
ncbi:MAG: hypothetical protein K2X81_00345, partial [Candidatus Obscuribacterales bacterium]|nr:hypothetical protein [Candidatus Obscuribacterales bacterium]